MCGGEGTRLRSVVADRQKTMAEANGKPFLEILLDWAAGQGVVRFVLCTGYKSDQVESYFRERRPDLDVAYSNEPSPLGTGGALHNALPLTDGGPVLVLNGDSICPLDLSSFAAYHARSGGAASLAVVDPGVRRDGGFIDLDPSGRILSFDERDYRAGRALNAGVYLFERAALAAIPPGRSSLEKDVLPSLVERRVYARLVREPLYDIGTPDRWRDFQAALAAGQVFAPLSARHVLEN
ncbi:MAG TPA: sugar phosphate nucleotidyltransferase [Elusimicrobiota bacterium]|nr:sugar phosphate nucleotidyltransferase [Elusimicrobiota bacterium]